MTIFLTELDCDIDSSWEPYSPTLNPSDAKAAQIMRCRQVEVQGRAGVRVEWDSKGARYGAQIDTTIMDRHGNGAYLNFNKNSSGGSCEIGVEKGSRNPSSDNRIADLEKWCDSIDLDNGEPHEPTRSPDSRERE